jgi:hypothetical protein
MSDDKTQRGPRDRSRINLSEDYEVRYWTKELGVTEDRLRELVRQHGNSVEKIREALRTAA